MYQIDIPRVSRAVEDLKRLLQAGHESELTVQRCTVQRVERLKLTDAAIAETVHSPRLPLFFHLMTYVSTDPCTP